MFILRWIIYILYYIMFIIEVPCGILWRGFTVGLANGYLIMMLLETRNVILPQAPENTDAP